jgi:hypothetical protein
MKNFVVKRNLPGAVKMKKRILILGLLLSTIVSSSFARNNDSLNKYVTTSFQNDFSSAREVKWEATKDFFKASFVQNEKILVAYYSHDGELIAVIRNISTSQLPTNPFRSVKKYLKDSWITDLFEVRAENERDYYLSMENADFKIVLKSSGGYGWQIFSKEKKLE